MLGANAFSQYRLEIKAFFTIHFTKVDLLRSYLPGIFGNCDDLSDSPVKKKLWLAEHVMYLFSGIILTPSIITPRYDIVTVSLTNLKS